MEESSIEHTDDFTTNANGVKIGLANNAVAQEKPAGVPGCVAQKAEKPRTFGLRFVDVVLYPIITNVSVFAISVAATYLTMRGGDRTAAGKLKFGKVGEWFQHRGEKLMNMLKSAGMTHDQADMSRMVAFSFIDGSAMAPVVKLVEDRREDIACAIDYHAGTQPEDLSVYEKEPKQSWTSVLGGRFATAAIVVPTAVLLDKRGLNEVLFNKPGMRAGAWLAKKPEVVKWFGKFDIKELSRIGFFEAFYTSVCTAGLYFSSRGIANFMGDKWKHKPHPADEKKTEAKEPSAYADHKIPHDDTERRRSGVKPDIGLKRPRPAMPAAGYCDKYVAETMDRHALAGV